MSHVFYMCLALWQVMCVFKALHKNHHEDHTPLSEQEFYSFYEFQNLKWREVREDKGDRDGGVFIPVVNHFHKDVGMIVPKIKT